MANPTHLKQERGPRKNMMFTVTVISRHPTSTQIHGKQHIILWHLLHFQRDPPVITSFYPHSFHLLQRLLPPQLMYFSIEWFRWMFKEMKKGWWESKRFGEMFQNKSRQLKAQVNDGEERWLWTRWWCQNNEAGEGGQFKSFEGILGTLESESQSRRVIEL